jgi:citrate synthase
MERKGKKSRVVADLMSAPPVTATAEASLATTAAHMSEHQVGSVVVVDGAKPVGILTERDLLKAAAAAVDPDVAKVTDWMTKEPHTVRSTAPVVDAWKELATHNYRHIPVVDAGRLVGVVSMRDLMTVAQLRPVDGAITDVPRGLKGVVVAETSIGDVRGQEGFFHYRQYSAVELAQSRSLEDVWYLLIDGEVPNAHQQAEFANQVGPLRTIPPSVIKALPDVAAAAATGGALDGLRTAISLLASAEAFQPSYDLDHAALRRNGLRISAVTPTLVAALHRLQHGQQPIDPNPSLGHAANYLWMVTGENPDPDVARALEQYLILTVDHGFNASTFTARVIASTGADMGAAITGAIGALSGPLHGGAPSRALETLEAIGTPDRTSGWVRDAVERGDRIMGFGHAVYKTDDPRSLLLRGVAERLGGDLARFAVDVEQTIVETLAELKPGRQLYANVEYYAGVVMARCGLPPELFTPTFACSRVIGWAANVLEQAADNRIIRPSARYIGPPPPQPIPEV